VKGEPLAEYNRLNWDELQDFPQAELPDDHPWPERRLFAMRIYSVPLECQNLAMSAGRFKPGESLERHSHGDTEEIYFLVAGKAQVMIGDEVHEARPLDAFRFPPHTERSIYNHGDEDCFWIFMGAPAHELIEYMEEVQGG
jgi:quercetin dioxygenase-like cupin family protein